MNDLVILPAVDIQYGRAVQLQQGVSESETVFGEPVAMANRWRGQGARWLHLVDLDAAFGRGRNTEPIQRIVAESGLDVELAGGIRDDASLEAALATGCRRVNIGTAAVESPDWCDEVIRTFSDKIAVALDVRGEALVTRGWTSTAGSLWSVIDRLNEAGCARLVVTDTVADGTLSGVNPDLWRQVCARTPAAVVASGGVATARDIEALALLPVEGVIIGTALYKGTITYQAALQAGRRSPGATDTVK